MRLLLLLISLSFIAASAQASEPVFEAIAKTKTIRCGYFSWPPYISKDPNTGALSGINYDVMEAIGAFLGYKVEWTAEIGVGETVTALNSGKFDVMCASLWPDPARMATMELTNPTFYSPVYTLTRKGDTRFDGDLDKANNPSVKVAYIDGDTGAYLAHERLPRATPVALPQTASGGELLIQVVSKKADLVFSDMGMINDFSKTNPGTVQMVSGLPPIRVFGEHLAVRQGEYHLRDSLNIAISQLVNDGIIAKITDRYNKKYSAKYLAPVPTAPKAD